MNLKKWLLNRVKQIFGSGLNFTNESSIYLEVKHKWGLSITSYSDRDKLISPKKYDSICYRGEYLGTGYYFKFMGVNYVLVYKDDGYVDLYIHDEFELKKVSCNIPSSQLKIHILGEVSIIPLIEDKYRNAQYILCHKNDRTEYLSDFEVYKIFDYFLFLKDEEESELLILHFKHNFFSQEYRIRDFSFEEVVGIAVSISSVSIDMINGESFDLDNGVLIKSPKSYKNESSDFLRFISIPNEVFRVERNIGGKYIISCRDLFWLYDKPSETFTPLFDTSECYALLVENTSKKKWLEKVRIVEEKYKYKSLFKIYDIETLKAELIKHECYGGK